MDWYCWITINEGRCEAEKAMVEKKATTRNNGQKYLSF